MIEPRRFWWARPRKLLAMERPGGGGRSHRPERREGEIAWLVGFGSQAAFTTRFRQEFGQSPARLRRES